MADVPNHRRCPRCYFCRRVAGQLCCLRNAPVPDPATGRARWPTVEPTDFRGAFCHTTPVPNRKSSIIDDKSQGALPVHTDAFGDYCKIPLSQGKFAKVDPEDYIWLSQFRWCCKIDVHACYAVRTVQVNGRSKRIFMHRQIMNDASRKRSPAGFFFLAFPDSGQHNRLTSCDGHS